MKKLLLLLSAAVFLIACESEQNQYTESSPEIDSAKELLKAYEAGNFEEYRNLYADTAKIYHNSTTPTSLDEMISSSGEGVKMYSSYGFGTEYDLDMVTTDKGNKWVGFWGVWNAKLAGSGEEFNIPAHFSMRFVDGKIVEEWGYWDSHKVAEAIEDKMEASQGEADDMQGEQMDTTQMEKAEGEE